LPGNLQPGESVVEYAAFATQMVTGQFSLRSNDGYMAVLAASTVCMVEVPSPDTSMTAEPSPSPPQAVSFACKVLQTGSGETTSAARLKDQFSEVRCRSGIS
jgi:hypothetical protein